MTDRWLPNGSRWEEWGARHRLTMQPRGFHVYVAWGADRTRPLYVGKSASLWSRLGTHVREAAWADQVEEFEAYSFDTEQDALDIEAEAIAALDPIYNTVREKTRAQREAIRERSDRLEAERRARRERWYAEDIAKQERRTARTLAKEQAAERAALREFRRRSPKIRVVRPPRVPSPWPRGPVKLAPNGYPDFFTPKQFDIIRRVQKAGRP